jgi:hypothetical protein
MKVKLDENIGRRGVRLLRLAGHDVITVPEQELCSAPDKGLISICRNERRCLVTLDLDFGNPLLFKPEEYFGIAVFRLPPRPAPEDLDKAIETLIGGLAHNSIANKLWIVQPGRIRIYQST